MATRLLYQRKDCRWAWQLTADNGQVIATDGSQGYENEADARNMADRIIAGEFAGADKKIRRNDDC
ncbi:MAG: YegP family protein [Acidimicrobiia bacterium]|nr:YegP family protein [Acidimicrobiia bacterium]